MKGEKNGNKYLSCVLQENLLTQVPTVKATSCGGNTVTVTIPNTPENQHNRYTIDWGNGSTDVINTSSTALPQERKKTYSGNPNAIKIQGTYIRNSSPVCSTNFIQISPDSDKNTLLHTLEGENNGKEVFFGLTN